MDDIIKNMLKNLSRDELTEIRNLINSILQRRDPGRAKEARSYSKLAPEPPDKLAPEPPDKLAPEPPDKLAPEPLDKLAPEPPDKLAPEPPDKLAPEPPDKLAPEPPDKLAPEPPDKLILPSKIVVKSSLKYPAKRKTKPITKKTKKRRS
ncbi:MAG: hypothetical protein ACE144_11335 [Thermodesulfobacteriota bacterium]